MSVKTFFSDIFEYHHYFNQQLADLLHQNHKRISARSIPLFSHCINAHQIWNARILGNETLGVHDVHSLKKCKLLDISNYKDTLAILKDIDLQTRVNYTNSKQICYQNTVQEILFHIANHFTHHKGQIIADLRSQGIEPLVTDYIFYKR